MDHAARAEESGSAGGFLQRIDPRVKLAGLLLMIVAAVLSHRLVVTGAIFAVALLLAVVSGRLVLRTIATLWGGVLLFTGAIVLPALFTTPGKALWIVPGTGWIVTVSGWTSVAHLIVRAETTATLASLMVLTTRWTHLLKALRIMHVPNVLVVILGMTHRYIFLMLQLAHSYFEARRARMVGKLKDAQRRSIAVSGAAVLLSKSMQLTGDVYESMQARGFRGAAYTLHEFRMNSRDWLVLGGFVMLAAASIWMGSL